MTVEKREIFLNQEQTEIFEFCRSNADGLTEKQAQKRYSKYNRLPEKSTNIFKVVFESAYRLAFIFLIFCSGFSYVLSLKKEEPPYEALILFISAAVYLIFTTIRALKNTKIFTAVSKMDERIYLVKRDGEKVRIPQNRLVFGDVVILHAGDIVPLDMSLLSSNELLCDESAIGLSDRAAKKENPFSQPDNMPRFVFKDTAVLSGNAEAMVLDNKKPLFEDIKKEKKEYKPSAFEAEFWQKDRAFSISIILSALLIFGLGLLNGLVTKNISNFMFVSKLLLLSLSICALPFAFTVSDGGVLGISRKAKELSEKNIILKKREDFLKLSEIKFLISDFRVYEKGIRRVKSIFGEKALLANAAALLSSASKESGRLHGGANGKTLYLFAEENGVIKDELLKHAVKLAENRTNIKTVLYKTPDGFLSFAEGEPADIYRICSAYFENGENRDLNVLAVSEFQKTVEQFEKLGQSVRAYAFKTYSEKPDENEFKNPLKYTLLGLLGSDGEISEKAEGLSREITEAGVSPVIFTEYPFDIALEKGLASGLIKNGNELYGEEKLSHLSDEDLKLCAEHARVYCRLRPNTKKRVLAALKSIGKTACLSGSHEDFELFNACDLGFAVSDGGCDVLSSYACAVILKNSLTSSKTLIESSRDLKKRMLSTYSFSSGVIIATVLLTMFLVCINGVSPGAVATALIFNLLCSITATIISRAFPAETSSKNFFKKPLITGLLSFGLCISSFFANGESVTAAIITLIFSFGFLSLFYALKKDEIDGSVLKKPSIFINLAFMLIFTGVIFIVPKTATLLGAEVVSPIKLLIAVLLSLPFLFYTVFIIFKKLKNKEQI
ncbi:MAG: P-type ATPase [Candidatus Fimenecus sp.]